MKKQSSLQTIMQQLTKLSQLMEQQQEFNKKYIVEVLQNRSSYQSSTLSDCQFYIGRGEGLDGECSKASRSQIRREREAEMDGGQKVDQNNLSQSDQNQVGEWELDIPQGLGRQNINLHNRAQQLHNYVYSYNPNYNDQADDNQNDKTMDINKDFYRQLQKQLGQSNIDSENAFAYKGAIHNNSVDLDEQTTTKSLPIEQQYKLEHNVYIFGQSDSQYIKKVSNKDKYKQKEKQQSMRKCEVGNNYQSSAAATQTLEMSLQKSTIKNINNNELSRLCKFKKYKQGNDNKNKLIYQIHNKKDNKEGCKNDKVRRPFTAIKPTLTTNKNQSINEQHKITKLDKNQLKKLKEKDVGLQGDKKNTNRKTKREGLNKNKSTTKLENLSNINGNLSNGSSNLRIGKKNQSNCEFIDNEYCYGGGSKKDNIKTSSGKGWMKSIEKPNKKLNKLNITKLQQFKKNTTQVQKNEKNGLKTNKNQITQSSKHDGADNISKFINVHIMPTCSSPCQNYNNPITQSEHKRNMYCHSATKKSSVNPHASAHEIDNHSKHYNEICKNTHTPQIGLTGIEKLDFEKKIPIMQRILQSKNLFKLYNIMNNSYSEAAKKINTKYMKGLQKEIRELSEEAIFKMKILRAVVVFFSQFFVPSSKSIMGIIAKNHDKQNNQQQNYKESQQQEANIPNKSEETLIISLLDRPKDLLNIIQTLPLQLYSCNALSQTSIVNLLSSYETINEKLDENLNLQLFMVKKQKIYCYFHELVEFIKFLQQNELIEKTERKNLKRNKKSMIGYYSSRSRREGKGRGKNSRETKNMKYIGDEIKNLAGDGILKLKKKGCDSQRKLTTYDGDTQRGLNTYNFESLMKNNSKTKVKKEQKDLKAGMQKQNKMNLSQQKEKYKY